jgi:GWxTD domain-containing protein
MRRFIILIIILFASHGALTQSISGANFNYWYNGQAEVIMQLYSVVRGDSVVVLYTVRGTEKADVSYLIHWEKRDSYDQRQGAIIVPKDTIRLNGNSVSGSFQFQKPEKPWLLVAKVTKTDNSKSWYFFRQIEKHFPVNGFLEKNNEIQARTFIPASDTYRVQGSGTGKPIFFSYYKENFPSPSPPFVDVEFKMDRFLFPDSTFKLMPGDPIGPFSKEGLYLGQEDTLSAEGFSFLVKKEPYPKFNKLNDLKGPMLFVTTKEENDQLGAAGEDKAKFDKVILDITGDKDRAKNFIRSFFKRIEYANFTFTSYKEGWKTDRGMIVIVFGAPDAVTVNGAQEIWYYKSLNQRFYFNKSGSVYSPDHYVLIRDKNCTENWYQTIDLWRKSRF